MVSGSEDPSGHQEASEPRKRQHSVGQDPVSGRRRRVNTNNDIVECGGQFQDTTSSYPPQLHISEEDDAEGSLDSSRPERNYASDIFEEPVAGPAADTGPVTPMGRYLTSTSYLQPSDLEEFYRQREARRTRSRRTVSSVARTHDSEYVSAKSDQASSHTEHTQAGDAAQDNGSRTSTPYFTPSVTPSRRSEETRDDDDHSEGRAPDSPNPRSDFFPYNERYGLGALESFEERFHGAGNRGPSASLGAHEAEEE